MAWIHPRQQRAEGWERVAPGGCCCCAVVDGVVVAVADAAAGAAKGGNAVAADAVAVVVGMRVEQGSGAIGHDQELQRCRRHPCLRRRQRSLSDGL